MLRGDKLEVELHEGYIKLFRKSIKHPLFSHPAAWHYWIYCLLKANHAPKKIIWNKKEMIVGKGSFITGRKKASRETGLSEKNIRTAIETLKNLEMITSKTASRFTLLSICNYEKYQLYNSKNGQQRASRGPAEGHKQELINTIKKKTLTDFKKQKSVYKVSSNEKSLKTKKTPSNPDINVLKDYIALSFKDKFGQPMAINHGRDGKTLKTLLYTYNIEQLKDLWNKFISSDDAFIQKTGYSINIFQTQINKLLSADKRVNRIEKSNPIWMGGAN